MSVTSNQSLIEKLFSAGAHFGFKKSRRHPTVTPYLYGTKEGNDIFDLEQTAGLVAAATAFLEEAGKNGKVVLFVGTKEEASRIVKDHALQAEAPYVTNRWIGGMLTNFSEIKKRVARLHELMSEKESGELERKYTKKERVLIGREATKLEFNFGGIKDMERTPDAMLIVDPRHDVIALTEARDKGIPVVAIMSSDNDISKVDHPVIVNDALQASVAVVLSELTTAYTTGKAAYTPRPKETTPRAR